MYFAAVIVVDVVVVAAATAAAPDAAGLAAIAPVRSRIYFILLQML